MNNCLFELRWFLRLVPWHCLHQQKALVPRSWMRSGHQESLFSLSVGVCPSSLYSALYVAFDQICTIGFCARSSVYFCIQILPDITEFHFLSSSPRVFPCLLPITTSYWDKLAFPSPIWCKGWLAFGLPNLRTANALCGWMPRGAKNCENKELQKNFGNRR